jgi:cytochrome b561
MQATLAGQFLSGTDSAVSIHEVTGWTVAVLGFLQILLALAVRTPLWFTIASLGTFLGESLQVGTGYGRFLNVHIPLAILIFGVVVWQTIWAFRERRA